MARDGLFALLCAVALFLLGPAVPALAAPGDDRDDAVAAALAVQTALQQGADFLQRGDPKSAVRVLEEQLPRIGGNPKYLNLLRDSYRAYIVNLKLAKQDAEVERYTQRLKILDPGAVLDGTLARGANTINPTPPPPPSKPDTPPKAEPATKVEAPPKIEAPAPKVTARGTKDDPFEGSKEDRKKASSLLARAEEAFANHRFGEANDLYSQAYRTDAGVVTESRERWAYCKLERVADRLNQANGTAPFTELEKEARDALQLAPSSNEKLHDFGTKVLAEIDRRKAGDAATAVKVKHFERSGDGWARAETTNFRIFHNESREFAEQAAQIAERTRSSMAGKWFGGFKDDWDPRCDIYIYSTAAEYCKATGVPNGSPGHSSFKTDGPRVLSRRIDLHCEDPKNMLGAVLPHEATHVVLAGQFGEQPIPRWADEGIAVLTEPRDKINRHLRNLARCREEIGLYTVKQLMQMSDYPEPRYITVFYAQSVSLVEFLAEKEGPETLTKFLRAAPKQGYETALKQFYGYKNFDELHQDWKSRAFAAKPVSPATGVAQGGN